MSKLDSIQKLLTNDLTRGRMPFPDKLVTVPGDKEYPFRIASLECFQQWTISGIVGGREPSHYSNSPGLWNPYFQALDRPGVFFAFDLPESSSLAKFLEALLDVSGFVELTVTDPYKEEAFRTLKTLGRSVCFSEQAEVLELVNHVISAGDTVRGLNTDGIGMIRALSTRISLQGKTAVILGAGGSAASIAYELIRLGMTIFILNRTESRAEALAGRLKAVFPKADVAGGGFDALPDLLPRADLCVNAVALGCPLNAVQARSLADGVVLAETKYGSKAELKDLADRRGAIYVGGNEMLFHQFVAAADVVYPVLDVSAPDHRRAVESVRSMNATIFSGEG